MGDNVGKPHERIDQAAQAIRDLAKPQSGFVMVLDFCEKKICFSSGGAFGGKDKESIHFSAYDVSSGMAARRIASMHFEHEQWKQFVEYGNKLFEHHVARNDPP